MSASPYIGKGASEQTEPAGRVPRARVTQIMNLLLLAPDIQEDILSLPPTTKGKSKRFGESLLRFAFALWIFVS